MKICHVTSVHQSTDPRVFQKECVSLAKAGYETYLVAKGESREDQGVHVIGVGAPPAGRLKRMTVFSRQVVQAALAVDAEVYHLHDPELLLHALTLKRKGKKVIFDSHEFYTLLMRDKYYLKCAGAVAWLYGKFETYVFRRIDAVVAPCTKDGKDFFAGKTRRTAIVANYALKSELYDAYVPGGREEPVMCYVGALNEARGITNLVRTADKAGMRLILGGDFQPPAYGEILKDEPGYALVDYRGHADRSQVRQILQEASIGMYTLRNVGQYNIVDTFGVKVYEYMSMALPIVMSDSAYARRVKEAYDFGILVDPDDVEQMAQAVRYLADHPEERARMGAEGRRAVAEAFNWDSQAKVLVDLYRDLIGDPA